ncbi:MerR family transcriptional regulator [Kitasatospora sp. NPDC058190]|uniref:MerR family transcriptional regulator n=1 Tax=Kitasatospora sp. NPDC058190 TaxID=3346371 RepID=UPI0036DE8070
MISTLAIGDFSRATHLSVKMLRHYHEIGLLEPVAVDPDTGYRRYGSDQISTAQIIRRFRDLDMPLDEIHKVLTAPDVEARNRLISGHLARLEANLARTEEAVSSLRNLLDHPAAEGPVQHRYVPVTLAAAITDTVDVGDALTWYQGALGELKATVTAQGIAPTGPAGGIFSNELFADGRGQATVFLPCDPSPRLMGRVAPLAVPSVELATVVHAGSHADIDRAYGALGAYVTRHALAVEGPIREYYLVGPTDTADDSLWRTEVGWPIFRTRPTR